MRRGRATGARSSAAAAAAAAAAPVTEQSRTRAQRQQLHGSTDENVRRRELATRVLLVSRVSTIMTFTSEINLLNPLSHRRHHQQQRYHHYHQKDKTLAAKMIIQQQQQQIHLMNEMSQKNHHQVQQQGSTTNNAIDPVYLEDDEVFYNLIIKESSEQTCKQSTCRRQQAPLIGQPRHLLLSWMLKVCEHEYCEEDIFSLATMILDKFLLFKPINKQLLNMNNSSSSSSSSSRPRRRLRIKKVRKKPFMMMDFHEPPQQQQQQQVEPHHQFYCNEYDTNNDNNISMREDEEQRSQQSDCKNQEGFDLSAERATENEEDSGIANDNVDENEDSDEEEEIIDYDVRDEELRHRQLYLFAACSLLLASKLRQTPRLCVQILIEFSKLELPIELTRDEILDGELLILSSLKWDLGSLVTPNDFLTLILRKCHTLLEPFSTSSPSTIQRRLNQQQQQHHHHYRYQYRRLSSSLSDHDDSSNSNSSSSLDHELGTTLIGATRETATTIVVVPSLVAETPSALITPNLTPDEMIEQQAHRQRQPPPRPLLARCDEFKVKRHTQTLLELCLMGEFSSISHFILNPSLIICINVVVVVGFSVSNFVRERKQNR